MLASGFANAQLIKLAVVSVVAASVAASIGDIKHLFYIQVVPHLWQYWQAWRLVVWPFCYANSTEVLFGAMLLYQLRLVERLWGGRKLAVCVARTVDDG